MNVSDIHASGYAKAGWVMFIEGLRYAWTDIPALAGTGVSSWIGTAYGDREVLLGLDLPGELPLGETDPWSGRLEQPRAVQIGLVDLGNQVAEIFKALEADATTDSMGSRLSPLQDPAPASVPGPAQIPVPLWGRYVGIEAIGPAGQRRYYWCTPGSAPPLDHPAGVDLPPIRITDTPTVWAGRKVTVYRVIKDPDTNTWPSWTDQHNGGGLWWFGSLRDEGRWSSGSKGERKLSLSVFGPADWLRKSVGMARPTRWWYPSGGVVLTEDQSKVACWIGSISDSPNVGDGIAAVPSTYYCHTLASGDTIFGLTTKAQIVQRIADIIQTTISNTDNGGVLAANNSSYTGPNPPAALSFWQDGEPDRDVSISADGSIIRIKCEIDSGTAHGFYLGLALDVAVVQLMGWNPDSVEWQGAASYGWRCPVGGTLWGENPEDDIMPDYHYVGLFETRSSPDDPVALWENGGKWQTHEAPFPSGTVTLHPDGGDDLRLALGEVRCEGQLSAPYTFGSAIDSVPVDSAGWWLFSGKRLTVEAYLAGEDPEDFMQVFLCEWVTTSDGDAVEVDQFGYALIRTVRLEDPRAFGLPFDRMTEPWTLLEGELACAPISVLGGIGLFTDAPSYRNRLIPSCLLSSGTAYFAEVGGEVTVVPGDNDPGDLPPGDPWAGDIEKADLGLGLPPEFVYWPSWYAASSSLPGGSQGAINRVVYSVFGTAQLEGSSGLLIEAMRGAGLAWSLKRKPGGVVPAFGAFDPLKKLSLADVEVTLTRADMAEFSSALTDDGPMWRGEIELRETAPQDRFRYATDRDPVSRSTAYEFAQESLDEGRRFRDGNVEWEIVDGGLHNPAPWLGTPSEVLWDWTGQARERFAIGYGQRIALQQRIYSNTYNGRFAGLLGPGTIVRVIDPTAEAPDGTRGLDHLGRVRYASIITKGTGREAVRVTIEIENKADEVRVFGPAALAGVDSWDSGASELTIVDDYAVLGGAHDDTIGFVQPSWDTHVAGAMRVAIYQSEDGVTFPAGFEVRADIASVDPLTPSLSFTNIVGTLYRDMIKVVVAAPWDEQTAPWVLAIFMPVTEPEGTFDGEPGYRL